MKKNIIANLIGKFWSVISVFLFIPLYIKYLGIEGYSIISFSILLTGILTIIDAGLASTLSRELARLDKVKNEKVRMLRTLESCYFILVGFIIFLLMFSSKYLANNWLNLSSEINANDVSNYIKIIGLGIGFELISRFYIGGLLGLENQVRANILQVSWGVLRNGLVVLLLMFYDNLYVFFIWQTSVTIIYFIVLRYTLYKYLDFNFFYNFPIIEKQIIRSVWKFAGGMLLIIIVAALNTQIDKMIISKLLSIENLGYYTLAFSLASGITAFINPVSVATLPRFTSMYSQNKLQSAQNLFKIVFLLSSIISFSIAAILMFNSKGIIWVWTGDLILAEKIYTFLPFLAIGTSFLAMQYIPFNIVIANGFTKFNNYIGIISLGVTMPGYWYAIKIYGPLGGAIIFCFVQILITFIFLFLVQKKFLQKVKSIDIYIKPFFLVIFISFSISWIFSNVNLFNGNRFYLLLWYGFTWGVIVTVEALVFVKHEYIFENYLKIKNRLKKND